MNRAFLLMLLFVVAACESGNQSSQKHNWMDATIWLLERLNKTVDRVTDLIHGPPRIVARGAKPELIVKNRDIRLDGQPLRIDAPIKEWLDILGPPSQNYRDYILIWDSLGFYVEAESQLESSPETWTVNYFRVNLTPSLTTESKSDPDWAEPMPRTKGVFRGYLEVNGVGVDDQSTLRDVMRGIDTSQPPMHFFACDEANGGRSCEAYANVGSHTFYMNFDFTVDDSEQEYVTSFSFRY